MSDLNVEEQGLSPFGLLEKKVVKEGATDFQNVAYLTIQMSSSYQVLISLGLEWCDFFTNINDTTFFCKRIMLNPIFPQTAKDRVDSIFFTYLL